MTIQFTSKKVGELLKEGDLRIPSYQRPYKWNRKHIRNLFYDLRDAMGKKEYQITDKGVEALRKATLEMICERKPTNTHFMTGFATSFLLDNEELVVALSKRKESLKTDLSNMLHERENSQHHTPIAQQLFSLGQALMLAELNWINQEIHLLQGGNEDGI